MAQEIKKIITSALPGQDPILIMGGHDEGIVTWGETLENAGEIVLKYYKSFLEA
jgi:hypothetical protein